MPDNYWPTIGSPTAQSLLDTSLKTSTSPESRAWSDYFKQQVSAQGQRPAVGFQTTNQDQARLEQQKVIQALQQQARGDLNSLAQQQLQQGYGQARAQQSSLGSTMRGQGAGAAMRGIQQGQQGIQRGFAGDQQMLMLQEQQAAQALLAQMLQQQQGQDIAQAGGMAQGALGSQGLDDAMRQFYFGSGIATDVANQQIQGERGRATLGFDLAGRDIQDRLNQQLMQMGAGAAGAAERIWSNSQQPGYRQVDGQDSIVPDWDK